MAFKEIYDVPKNHQLTINLPQNFPSKKSRLELPIIKVLRNLSMDLSAAGLGIEILC